MELENIILSEVSLDNRPKIVCSPSYVDIRSRANTTRGLDFDHMIKARAHKGGIRIGKKPQKTKIAFDVLSAKELMQIL
jgi:hypothetical protein